MPAPADAEDTLSGAIEFDPRGSIGTTARIEASFTGERFTVRPATGMCLLCPGS